MGSFQSVCGTDHAFVSFNKLLFCPFRNRQAFKHQNKDNKLEFCGESAPGGGALLVLQANKLSVLQLSTKTSEKNDSFVEGSGEEEKKGGMRVS